MPDYLLGNNYLLLPPITATRRQQLIIDGRPHGLSADIFSTAAALLAPPAGADVCWLDSAPCSSSSAPSRSGGEVPQRCGLCGFRMPRPDAARALGHLINHPPPGVRPNTEFSLVPLVPSRGGSAATGRTSPDEVEIDAELMALVPNLNSAGLPPVPRWVRVVVFVPATFPIEHRTWNLGFCLAPVLSRSRARR